MKKLNLDLSTLRRTAGVIASAAVTELYPDVQPLGGSDTSIGFFSDFYFPHPIHTHIIEEKMRQIVSEKREIRTLEMVPVSAKELLKSQKFFEKANEIDETKPVQLIKMGSFCDLYSGEHLKNSSELGAFKIETKEIGKNRLRIEGFCHTSKEELKRFLKKLSSYKDPIKLGEETGYWKGNIWFLKGLQKRDEITEFFKQELFKDALEILGPIDADRDALHRSVRAKKVAEIYLDSRGRRRIRVSFFSVDEPQYISSLHLIGKTLTMLGFRSTSIPLDLGTQFVVLDGLDRKCPLVKIEKIGGTSSIDFKIELTVEDVLLQMIEKRLAKLENQ